MLINNYDYGKLVTGTSGDDTIYNYSGEDDGEGDEATISAGLGNDYVRNINGYDVTFIYSGGNDTIEGFDSSSILQIAQGTLDTVAQVSGNDLIFSVGNNTITLKDGYSRNVNVVDANGNALSYAVKISVPDDGEEFYNDKDNATIVGSDNADTIENDGSNVSINAAGGNDIIYENGEDDTIDGGSGNDFINNTGYDVTFVYSGGNDTIEGFDSSSILQIAQGTLDTVAQVNGNDLIFSVGNNTITLKNAYSRNVNVVDASGNALSYAVKISVPDDGEEFYNDKDNATIVGSNNANTINNDGSNVSINAAGGDDSIRSGGDYSTIDGGAGNDEIHLDGDSFHATVNSGVGNDYIYVEGSNGSDIKIYGGDGDDTINSQSENTILDGGAGNDSIENSGSKVSILGGDGNDTIGNTWYGSNVSIDGGAGDDSISNDSDNVTFIYSGGNDTIAGFRNNSTLKIAQGTLNPVVESDGTNLFFSVGENKITLKEAYSLETVNVVDAGGNALKYGVKVVGSNDLNDIYNRRDNSTLVGSDNADTINNDGGKNVSIAAMGGDDSIRNYEGNNSTINGGNGTDTIVNYNSSGVTMTGDGGNDFIYNESSNASSINGGDGSDTIQSVYNSINVTLSGGAGDDSIRNENGANSSLLGDGGNDTLENFSASNVTMSGGADNDYLFNNAPNVTMIGDSGNDDLQNDSSKVSISAGEGDDFISNSGENVTIDAGTGNDSITNSSSKVTIAGDSGNDYLFNEAENVSLSGGTGNDSIENTASKVTIDSGSGDDSIYSRNDAENILFVYSGGNDLIEGFNSSATLKIAQGSLNSIATSNGNDLILSVDNYKVTLTGALELENQNIVDGSDNALDFKLNIVGSANEANNISNIKDGSTILGGNDEDTIKNSGGKNVSIDGGNGSDSITNENREVQTRTGKYDTIHPDNSTIIGGEGDDFISNSGENVTIDAGNGSDTVSNDGDSSTINGGSGDDSIHNYGAKVLINSGAGNDFINNDFYSDGDGKNVTINSGAGADTIENRGDSSSLDGGEGSDYIYNSGSRVTIMGGAGNDTFDNGGEKVLFKYTAGEGNDSISGFDENDSLQIGGGTGTYSTVKSGDDVIVMVGEGKITLTGVAYFKPKIVGNEVLTYSWTFNENVATYGTEDQTLITVTGVKSLSGISLEGQVVTIAKASVNGEAITITGEGYTLALADNVPKKQTTNAWTVSGTTATYKQTISAGYTLATNAKKINYAAKATKTLATVTGLKSGLKVTDGKVAGITLNGKVITLAASTLNQKKVTLKGEGYTLALASGVKKSQATAEKWKLDGTTATYKSASKTAGYILANNAKSITYSDAVQATTLATVTGVKSTKNLSVSDKVITLKKAALNANVSISGSYKFNFAAGDYKKTQITGSVGKDTVITSGKNLSIDMGAGADSVKVIGSSTTITGGKGKDTITNTGDKNIFIYNVGDGNDVINGFNDNSTLKIGSNGKGIYSAKTSGKNVIVTVGEGKISLMGAASLSAVNIAGQVEVNPLNLTNSKKNRLITGTDYDDKIKNTAQYVTIDGGAGQDSISNTAANVSINGGSGDDSITSSGKYDTIDAGEGDNHIELTKNSTRQTVIAGAGDDYILNAGKNNSISTGAGNDTILTSGASASIRGGNGSDVFIFDGGGGIIQDYDTADMIEFMTGTASVTTKNDDVIFTVGANKVTVKGGKDKVITYQDTSGELSYPQTVSLSGATTATLLQNYSKDSFNVANYGSEITKIDASAVVHDLTIIGNKNANRIIGTAQDDSISGLAGADTILGGAGNDTLLGGKGNDSLSGGAGSDVFVYASGDGNDIIANYAEEDRILITSGTANVTTSGSNVILNVGSGKITVKNAAKKVVTYVDSTGVNYYPKNPDPVILTGTGATLRANYSKATYTATAKLITVDASDVTRDLKIMGNAKANDIYGGSGNDSINGGVKADTLQGGAGNDTLLGGEGNDELYGGTGADVFAYRNGDGKDIIWDYAEEDKIQIRSGTLKNRSVSGNDVVLQIGSGSITVKEAANKNISIVDKNGKALGNANVPYWFTEDDSDFNAAQLDSIVETSAEYSSFEEEGIRNKEQVFQLLTPNNQSLTTKS